LQKCWNTPDDEFLTEVNGRKLNEKYTGLVDINQRELFTVVPLLVITIFLGIYPRPFLDMIKETMNVLIDQVVIVGGIAGIF